MSRGRQVQNLSAEEVFGFLHSSSEGLEDAEVAERLLEVGPNSVEVADRWRWPRSLARQFGNFFTILLILSGGICFVAHSIQPGESMNVLGWALLGVSLLNALFSFIQEYRAEKAMEALQRFLPPRVQVRRAGQVREILAEELVPGDLVLVGEGERISADARLVKCEGLVVNNGPLTGESKAVELTEAAVDKRLVESDNLVFAGCSIFKGSGEAVVFATGIRTEFGKLAHLSQSMQRSVSPLERETLRMVRILTIIAVTMGVGFFLYGVFSGRSLWVNLVFMMGIIVANVPEGLLPTFTLSLAMGSLRLARKNVLVKELQAVEALGAVHVICTDKTGTLTRNQLAVTHLGGCDGAPLQAPEGRRRLLELALCASEVHTLEGGLAGDPLDVAVAESYAETAGEGADLPGEDRRFFAFDVQKRRSAGLCGCNGSSLFAVKGAWESLRPMLSSLQGDPQSEALPIDKAGLERADAAVEKLAGAGQRVIAVAFRRLPEGSSNDEEDQDSLEKELVLAGFLGIEDPVRPEVPGAVSKCHRAGIEVIMITGDHPETARVIAEKSGILWGAAAQGQVLTGAQLEQLTEEQLAVELRRGVAVFARTTPEQKMKIVSALKSLHRVVAMTGDGVNDAPALKAADVGVAMGLRGTDVARESAQLVLLDDNFASIVAGIEEGRAIFANIKKFTNYVLVSNGPEIFPYLLYILLPVPLALTVIQILTIDLGTDIVPSMGLGQEPPDPEEMLRPPRERDQGLLTPQLIIHSYLFLGILEALWSIFLFFLVLVHGGWEYGQELAASNSLYRSATGIALATILLMQIGNLLGRRSARHSGLDRGIFSNRLILLGILIQIVFSWAVLYFPPAQRVLGTAPVPWSIYLLAWLGIPLIFGLDLLRKLLLRSRQVQK